MSTNRALQPPLPAALRPYEDVMKLLAAFSGPNCEVVLHDLSDPVHSVVRVENGEVTGRAVGQGLRHLVPNLLRMPEPMTARSVSRDTEAKDLQKDADIELEGSVLKTVYAMIDRMTERVRAGRSSSAVLTREERLPLVRFMDTRGVFLVKGALDYAAERLGVSKVTLYSALDLLRRESESAGSLASGRQKK